MNIQKSHQDIFVTRYWVYTIPELLEFHTQWSEAIESMRCSDEKKSNQRSLRQGWKTHYLLFENPIFQPLLNAAIRCFKNSFTELGFDKEFNFAISGSINMTDPLGYNTQHGHAGCLLSAVYYVKVPKNSGGLALCDPRAAAKYSPLLMQGGFSSGNRVINPQEGQLVIFPSWLEHSVEQNLSDEVRISIPINAVAKNN